MRVNLLSWAVLLSVVVSTHQLNSTGTSPNSTNGDIRLSGGGSYYGLVEISYSGQWGTICDGNWDLPDAVVACRQLGFASAVAAKRGSYYGPGNGTVWLDHIYCAGTESRLTDCWDSYWGWGHHHCGTGHHRDAGVECSNTTLSCEYPALEDPSVYFNPNYYSVYGNGTQVYFYCAYGYELHGSDTAVCLNGTWTYNDTQPRCEAPKCHSSPPAGYLIIQEPAMERYDNGTEVNFSCPEGYYLQGSSNAYCLYGNWYLDAYGYWWMEHGPFCIAMNSTARPGDIRLRDGDSYYGRVEVWYNGTWGTVCDDYWDMADALVACRQLGFAGAVEATCCASYGQGTGQIWLDYINCDGSEGSLADCPHYPWGHHYCSHYEDAGVECSNATSHCGYPALEDPSVYFYPNYYSAYGNGTEVFFYCASGYDLHGSDTAVCLYGTWRYDYTQPRCEARACNSSALAGDLVIQEPEMDSYGNGSEVIFSCPEGYYLNGSSNAYCLHGNWYLDAYGYWWMEHGPSCVATNSTETNGDIRLRGGGSYYGRVEVWYNGMWGTVCDDNWGTADAGVACRQLGFAGAAAARCCAYYGQGTGYIWMDNVHCRGNESSLADCQRNSWGYHNCGHHEDAGVECLQTFACTSDPPAGDFVVRRPQSGPYPDGTEVSYSCPSELTLVGGTSAVCLNGNWSVDVAPTCTVSNEVDSRDVVLFCGSTYLQVDIPDSMVAGTTRESDLYFAGDPYSGSCRGFRNGNYITLNSSLTGCGTVYSDNNNVSYYQNTVEGLNMDNRSNAVVEYMDLEIPVICEFERSAKLQAHFSTVNEVLIKKEKGTFEYAFSIYDSVDYSQRHTAYPVVVSLGSELYFRAELLRSPGNLQIHLRTCHATPTSNYDDPTVYPFISDGCGIGDALVRVLSPEEPTQADFEIISFRFIHNLQNSEVWIHCEVVLCDVDDGNSECSQGCEQPRSRRSVGSSYQRVQRMVQGPIVLGNGKDQVSATGGDGSPGTFTTVFAVVALTMFVCLVAMGVVLARFGRKLRHHEYEALATRDARS